MKSLLRSGLLGLVFFISYNAIAQEFRHFKLKGEFKEALEARPAMRSNPMSKTSVFNQGAQKNIIDKIVAEKILQINPNNKSIIEDDVPPLLQKIVEIMGTTYNQIGQNQTRPLLLSHDLGGGVQNFSGFTWQKPLANFGLWANREIAPDLFSNNWIVHDTLLIRISASTLLTNLREEDLIDISDEGIGSFAGITFQRVYHYYHFAETFLAGLTADYSKLFMSFTKFNVHHVMDLPPYELMKKEDQFSFNAGGFVNSPPYYGFSGNAGVLVNVAFENELTIQSLGDADNKKENEFLRLSVDKKWNVSADAHLSVQLDFFKLLKLTLLSYDLEYSYAKSNKMHLSFYEEDKQTIVESENHKNEFKKIIAGLKDNVESWKDHIVQQDQRMTQNLNSKYSFLLLGKMRKKQTEQVKVIKDGVEKTFYKHYSQSIKYVQNLLSRIFNRIIYQLFEFESGIKNAAESVKKLTVEFEHEDGNEKEQVENENQFSVQLTQEYSAQRTHRWVDKQYRNETLKHLNDWTNLDHNIIAMFKSNQLRGPLQISSKIQIETAGLSYMNQLGEDLIFEVLLKVCRSKRKSDWLNPNRRFKMLRRPQVGRSLCVKNLGLRYLDYISDYYRAGYNDMTKFRKFVGKFFSQSKNFSSLALLFGPENVFMHGHFKATTDQGLPFSHHFKTGQFRGLGVIDNFMRQGGTTVPLNIE